MSRSLRWCGRLAAVLSALVLAGGYVATRAMPGLFQSFQVFGGEGGGRAIPAGGKSHSEPAAKPAPEPIIPSTKSAGIVNSSDFVASSVPSSQVQTSLREVVAPSIMYSSKSGPMFAASAPGGSPAPMPAVKPRTTPARQPARQVVLSDGTVVQLPGGVTGSSAQTYAQKRPRTKNAAYAPQQPAPQAQQPRPPEIMSGPKSAPIMLYDRSR
jgi:hypothetical protein